MEKPLKNERVEGEVCEEAGSHITQKVIFGRSTQTQPRGLRVPLRPMLHPYVFPRSSALHSLSLDLLHLRCSTLGERARDLSLMPSIDYVPLYSARYQPHC
jgi:hypothetical protein